jgi:hypothetical protein
MKTRDNSLSRTAAGFAAAAMSALTLGALVVLPARLEAARASPAAPAVAPTQGKTLVEVTIYPSHIVVVGSRAGNERRPRAAAVAQPLRTARYERGLRGAPDRHIAAAGAQSSTSRR